VSEFLQQALLMIYKKLGKNKDIPTMLGWALFGFASRRHLNDEKIFHVRSGAGHGGAIQKAKKLGMKIVVDHSIAHPAEVSLQLAKVLPKNDITISADLLFWRMVLKDCEQADAIVVNSDYVKETFLLEGWPSSKIDVIPLGVRSDFLGLKKSYKEKGPFRLLFTGNFGARKGANLLIQMAKKLQDKKIDFELHVVGTIEYKSQLPTWFSQASNIYLHGHVIQEDLKAFLSNADAYIFPTYAEGAAQSVKEAMAAGLPVITTKNSGAPIHHKQNGWIVPVHDVDALVGAVCKLKDDVEMCISIGKSASDTIKTEHQWSNYASKLKAVYYKLNNASN
jgi:glycosyltransferase involved in cell wall biosynthesis